MIAYRESGRSARVSNFGGVVALLLVIAAVFGPARQALAFDDEIERTEEHASPTGSADATAAADQATGSVSVSVAAGEGILPVGIYNDFANVGIGASRAAANARIVEELSVTQGGTYRVTVVIGSISGSASDTAANLAVGGALVHGVSFVQFYPCAEVCSPTASAVSSSGFQRIVQNRAAPAPPASIILETPIEANGPGFLRIETGMFARADVSGKADVQAQASGVVSAASLGAPPPIGEARFDSAISEQRPQPAPGGSAGALAASDANSGNLNVAVSAAGGPGPTGFRPEADGFTQNGVNHSRSEASARVIDNLPVIESGKYRVIVDVLGIDSEATMKHVGEDGLAYAESNIWALSKVDFIPCPDGPPCQLTPSRTSTVQRGVASTVGENTATSVSLVIEMCAESPGKFAVDAGFWARADSRGPDSTFARASGTAQEVAPPLRIGDYSSTDPACQLDGGPPPPW